MQRYIFPHTDKNISVRDLDVVIIGSGIAGLYAALHLDKRLSCVILTKDSLEISSSSLAQGGIAAVTEREDRFEYHYQDTLRAGAGLCDPQAVETIVKEGPEDIHSLIDYGINFDYDSLGHLMTTMEGGHGRRRILHCGGDATGREIVRTLKDKVLEQENIQMIEKFFVMDILTDDAGKVSGLIGQKNGEWTYLRSGCVIIASGGIGQVYRYTTNPIVATGDGMAMAKRAGAALEHMEFVQFHPTGFYTPQNRNKQCFLISEAVRGEGGLLYNEKGERFMLGVHELNELAPRDIVARAIYRQIKSQKSPYVKLCIQDKGKEFLQKRFPTIYSTCLKNGIDISQECIPVGPVQHYMMGGIKTDLWGTTGVEGLYACGEAACTGVHGANRLASNSTLECLVFGRRSAEHINDNFRRTSAKLPQAANISLSEKLNIKKETTDLKGMMIQYCGIVRTGRELEKAVSYTEALLARLDKTALLSQCSMELYNMATVAYYIAIGAAARKESVGAHYREDFPPQ